ncbi:SH3 domain-containing protein [Calothrix sp. UHCC 0171]|uniref:SH3 domain-containing protein n=1 Tax=Calothrix sp. UHCC 0171 TaxID=3110245 RepID=UPI002B1EA4BB|nr:SH3 domain-containing protein [Calothrix sp. UHCC 0171]MEA5571949.1 SH3 domain-containing protein [Calothrix sp. UHCC 0171]
MKLKTSLVATVLSLASIATAFPVKANMVNTQVPAINNDVFASSNPSFFNQSKQPNLIARTNWARLAGGRTRRINLRARPTINSRIQGYGLGGDRVQNLQCVQDNDRGGRGRNWCKVKFPRSGAIGWIRSDNIIFSDGGE